MHAVVRIRAPLAAALAWLCAAAALTPPLAAAAAGADAVSGADAARLEAGEILIRTFAVAGSELPRARVTAVVDAPIAKVWAIIDNCSAYKRTMIRVLESQELSRAGDVVTCRIKVDMPWPFDDLEAVTRATHRVDPGKRHERSWTLVKGSYKRNEGSWVLTPWRGAVDRTLAVYQVHAEPDISVPLAVQRRASRSALPELIEKLRLVSGARPRAGH